MSTEEPTGARVLLADNHQDVRMGLALLLTQNGYTVCAEAENAGEAMLRLPVSDADIVLVDISLGDQGGLDLLHDLRRLRIPALVYSMNEAPEMIQRVFNAGASGYVTKREDPDMLLQGLREVLAHRRFLNPRAAQSLASKALSHNDTPE